MNLADIASVIAQVDGFRFGGNVEPLENGLVNEVARLTGIPGVVPGSVVVKRARPFIRTAPGVALDPNRVKTEAQMLSALGPGGRLSCVCTPRVRAPQLLASDAPGFTIVIEDCGRGPDLVEWIMRSESDAESAREIGGLLGTFIARLHAGTWNDVTWLGRNRVGETLRAMYYEQIGPLAEQAGADDHRELGVRFAAQWQREQSAPSCVVMGDLWPASVLVRDTMLRIIDWEFARTGFPAQDVGMLTAHLWMLRERIDGSPQVHLDAVLDGFVQGYAGSFEAGTGRPASTFAAEIALYFGAEILSWTHGDAASHAPEPLRNEARERAAELAINCLRDPEAAPDWLHFS